MAHVFLRSVYEPGDRRALQQRAQILYETQDQFLEIYYDEENDFPVVKYVKNFTGNQNIRWYFIWSLEHATPTYRDILNTMMMGVQVLSSCGCCSAADILAQRVGCRQSSSGCCSTADILAQRVGAEQRFYQMTLYPI